MYVMIARLDYVLRRPRRDSDGTFLFFPCFFFTDTAPTVIYTLSLHDALPISPAVLLGPAISVHQVSADHSSLRRNALRSEEHTSELQSHSDLVCRLLLEKKNQSNGRGLPT